MIFPTPCISLDIETHGMARAGPGGEALPEQNHFHPARSMVQDKCPREFLALTCSITEWTEGEGHKLIPGETMVFKLWVPAHRKMLAEWVSNAKTILGFNLPFDIGYLRFAIPEVRAVLDGSELLVDAGWLNTYECEDRAFYSLKELAILFGIVDSSWSPPESFESCLAPDLEKYNGLDTHITIRVCGNILDRLFSVGGQWVDASESQIQWLLGQVSGLLWSCIRMSESGIYFSRNRCLSLDTHLQRRQKRCERILSSWITMRGKGRDLSRKAFIERILLLLPDLVEQDQIKIAEGRRDKNGNIIGLLKRTDTKQQVSFDDRNRSLLAAFLATKAPYKDRDRRLLRTISRWQHADKLLTSYLWPLLDPSNKSGCISPIGESNSDLLVAYPTWYPSRGLTKESSGGSGGGTVQARLAAKNPPGQTFPPAIQSCQCSRW